MSSGFHCIACSLSRGEPVELNGAPLNDKKNQVYQHFEGKPHSKAMDRVGAELFSECNVRKFFCDILRQPEPIFSDSFMPVQAVKNYIELHRGDVEWAIRHYAPRPPPLPEGDLYRNRWRRRGPTQVKRIIVSPLYATRCEKGWVKMLCCWDDVNQSSTCQRSDCKYNHVSVLLAATQSDEGMLGGCKFHRDFNSALGVCSDAQALFKVLPCNMAGMVGGCKIHRDFNSDGWKIPKFELAEAPEQDVEKCLRTYFPSTEEELAPFYIGEEWVLQYKLYNERVIVSMHMYPDEEDEDEGEEKYLEQ